MYSKQLHQNVNHFTPPFSPTPKIEWVRMGHRLPDRATIENHGKLLSIDRVNEDDSGKYMCKARNILGEANHSFDVSVEGKWENVQRLK